MDGVTPFATAASILVVDDQATQRMAVAEALNLMGYRADQAASGAEALARLSDQAYDLMLLDLRMPGMDGVEVMKRARAAHAGLLVIVLTAYGSLDSAIEAVRAGAADYLLKPSSLRDTEAAISRALRRRQEAVLPEAATEAEAVVAAALGPGGARGPVDTAVDRSGRFLTTNAPAAGTWGSGTLAAKSSSTLRCRSIVLDSERNLAVVSRPNGALDLSVTLTASETALLAHLMERPNRVCTCRELARDALGYDVQMREAQEIVRPHVSRLRAKLEADRTQPSLIRTIRGKGYLLSL
jgi:DNA-binding response OmpR family regulator